MKPQRSRRLANNAGQILIQVIVMTAVITAMLAIVGETIIRNRAQTLKNVDQIHYRLALQSTVDYAIYGLRQRWCFSENLNQDASCDLTHPASSERLMMSIENVQFIKELISAGELHLPYPVDNVQLSEFSRSIDIDGLSDKHPLYSVLGDLKRKGVSRLKVVFARDTDPRLPRTGREVYVRITATLSSPTLVGSKDMSVTSNLSIHPRELSTFALVVPGDIRLDQTSFAQPSLGDANFRQFSAKANTGKGLTFLSPVFANGNIHLPKGDDTTKTDGVYTPVTFAAKVILGQGDLYANNASFSPSKPGALKERTWADHHLFGGFQKGVESDGMSDDGLKFLAGLSTSSVVVGGESLMRQCISYYQRRSDVNEMRKSVLFGAPTGTSSASATTMRVGISDGNELNPQKNYQSTVLGNNWIGTTVTSASPSSTQEAVINVTVSDGSGKKVTLAMAKGSAASLKVPTVERDQECHTETTGTPPKTKTVCVDVQKNGPPMTVKISLKSVTGSTGLDQKNLADLRVELSNPGMLNDMDDPSPLTISMRGYDLTYQNTSPIKGSDDVSRLQAKFEFPYSTAASSYQTPTGLIDAPSTSGKDISTDWADFADQCSKGMPSHTDAFGSAGWDVSFTDTTRSSWNFATLPGQALPSDTNHGTVVGTYDMDAANSSRTNAIFHVISIAETCHIKASADFVAGFLVCEKLVIDPRSLPLRIIGTIIANRLEIDPSAYQAGISWSSIYYPQATFELRQAKILKSKTGRDCNALASAGSPLWHPIPSIQDVADRFACNAISLRAKANPFQWTTVDPDCGLLSGKTTTSCKHQVSRFLVIEHSQELQQ